MKRLIVICIWSCELVSALGQGQIGAAEPELKSTNENWSVHFQATTISQKHDKFNAPYTGPNSLQRDEPFRSTLTSTLFLGVKLWPGAEIYANPEISGGQGLSGALGVAGFPNGEATRVGNPQPTPYLARYFLRQRIDFGGDTEVIEADQNQLAGVKDKRNLTFTLGKYSAGDVFDDNLYSHDARTQFMDWALMDNGAWDYPADTRGYTYGLSIELNQPFWAARAGSFAEPTEANGAHLDHHFGSASGNVLELERKISIRSHPGKLRLLSFVNFAHMGSYAQALRTTPVDVIQSREYRMKFGFGINAEQELCHDLGAFFRAGWNDGRTETWAFTEIDQSVSAGLSLKGARWGRKDDVFGLAGVINGLSADHRHYLEAGGVGFIIGDGRLNYAPEKILESYYSLRLIKYLFVTTAYQFVQNPAYNRDRGPVSIGTLRLHVEF